MRTQESGDQQTSASRASRFFFSLKNMVFNALLSGLEVCVFTKGEMDKLQTHARRGWGAVKGDDNKTSVPSRLVRAQLGLWTVESTLRYRRLRWFHSMASQPLHHVQAVEFSKMDVEQFGAVLKRDREKGKTRVASAPEGRVVPCDQLFVEDIDGAEYRCECGRGFMSKKKHSTSTN